MAHTRNKQSGSNPWSQIEQIARTSVVQIIAQKSFFNWLEPYNKSDQEKKKYGTGFFIDDQGHILTNAHIVEQATSVYVRIPTLDSSLLQAEVIGFAPDHDLALLKLDSESFKQIKKNIHILPWGNPDQLKSTEELLILGFPLGHETVTTVRGNFAAHEFIDHQPLIQITSSINEGNSGGPVFNMQGKIIGIVISTATQACTIGYALGFNEIQPVLPELYKKKLIKKGSLGMRFNASTDALTHYLGNPKPGGYYINTVFETSHTAQAGIQEGDMLYKINDFDIDQSGTLLVPWRDHKISLQEFTWRLARDQPITLTVYRNGAKQLFTTQLTNELFAIRTGYSGYELIDFEILGGMVLMQLAVQHIDLLGRDNKDLSYYSYYKNRYQPVVVVSHVVPGSFLHQQGIIMPGYCISTIDQQEIKTLAQLRTQLQKKSSDAHHAFKMTNGVLTLLNVKELIKDEAKKAAQLQYPITPFAQTLIEKYAN
jgi:S1-C subfamily serine protease